MVLPVVLLGIDGWLLFLVDDVELQARVGGDVRVGLVLEGLLAAEVGVGGLLPEEPVLGVWFVGLALDGLVFVFLLGDGLVVVVGLVEEFVLVLEEVAVELLLTIGLNFFFTVDLEL